MMHSDVTLMVHCLVDEKRIRCLAEIAAHATQTSGITELSLLDHNMVQKAKDGHPLPYRYTVEPRPLVNCFEPKSYDGDTIKMRTAIMGAMFNGSFKKLPGQHCGVLWEAPSIAWFASHLYI